MAKFIPVIGEIYTGVESAVCLTASGLAKVCGDDKGASELLAASGNAWVEYAEGNAIATPIYSIILDIKGDHVKSDELKTKYLNAAGNTADGLPVVGHVKGIVHYAMGDNEKGHRSMEASTRSTVVLGAGVLTGGLGAGIACGAAIGAGSGIFYDEVATLADIAVNGKDKAKLHGSMALLEADKMTPNELAQSLMGIAGDGLAGAAGANLGENIRAHLSKSAAQKNLVRTYTEAGVEHVKNPRQAARFTMEAAKAAEDVQAGLNKNVNGCTTKVVDTVNGESGVGHSGRIQGEIRAQNYEQNGFTSKNQARNANTYSTHLKETFPEVKPIEGRSIPQNACAEHQAFNNYNNNNPDYSTQNTRTATVYNKQGNISTMPRCDNCSAYGPNMGDVVTDHVPHGTPVPAETYIAAGSTIGAWTTAAGGVILQQKKE